MKTRVKVLDPEGRESYWKAWAEYDERSGGTLPSGWAHSDTRRMDQDYWEEL